MQKTLLLSLLAFLLSLPLYSQMWNGQDTLYGNEWVNYDQSYFKIKVAQDGIYRLPYETLINAGIPVNDLQGSQYQIFYMGQEIPLYTSTDGALTTGDYLEFYGQKNRSQLDRYLFQNPDEEMLNPEYSLFTDTSAYFLTWAPTGTPTARYAEVANDLTDLPEKEEWYWDTLLINNHQNYVSKKYDGSGYVSLSNFDESEGFGSAFGNSFTFEIAPEHVASTPLTSQLVMRLASFKGDHHLRILINGEVVFENLAYPAYVFQEISIDVATSQVNNGFDLVIEGASASNDYFSVANVILKYPKTFTGTQIGRSFEVMPNSLERYFELEGSAITGVSPVIYSHAGERMVPAYEDGRIKFKWPSFSQEKTFLLSQEQDVQVLSSLEPAPMILFDDETVDYLIITHPDVRQTSDGSDAIALYSDYRSSSEGGNYNVGIFEIEQLYNQFAYGLNQHPLSIKNFGAFAKRFWQHPEFAVLIGRGYEYNYTRDESSVEHLQNQLPSFGVPAADNLFFSDLSNSTPFFAVGRISVSTGDQLLKYLDKVKEHEAGFRQSRTVKNFAWRKKVLHLVGGKTNEQQTFNGYLNSMGQELIDNQFGATVKTLKKETTEPVNSSPSGAAIEAVNAGVAIKAYLGHGSVVTTEDFAMDDPEVYENTGKYPLIFSLGCLTGNSFTPQTSISELFVRAQERGAIGYIASSGYGYASSLRDMSKEFYHLLGTEMYGETIGEIMSEVRGKFDENSFIGLRALVDQLQLNADPAVRINDLPFPDYIAHYESVKISPEVITTRVDSIDVNFDLYNIGAAGKDTLVIRFEHQLPTGEVQTYFDTIQTNGSVTNITTRIPIKGEGTEGVNVLRVEVDVDNRITELPNPEAETNNKMTSENGQTDLPFFIFDNTLRPVSPPEFGIVGQPDIVLKATTSDIFAPERSYIFEIDTTTLFNSPLKNREVLRADGGIVNWTPPTTWRDSTVYYWRVSPDSMEVDTETLPWNTSSFLYLSGSDGGWNQSHYYQFRENDLVDMEAVDSLHRILYANTMLGVIARAVRISPINNTRSRIFLDNERIVNVTAQPSISFAVFDPVNGSIWRRKSFRFNQTTQRQEAIIFVRDSIPKNYYVASVTFQSPGQDFAQESWMQDSLDLGDNLISVLEAQGAEFIREIAAGASRPYVFAFEKDAFKIDENLAEEGEENAFITFDFPGRWDEGQMTTPKIGPAQQWQQLSWQMATPTTGDSLHLKIWGFDENATNATVLVDSVASNELLLNGLIDANQYPYLQLQFFSRDTLLRQAPAVKYWRLHYEETPEIAIDPIAFYRDTLQQGEALRLNLDFYNLSATLVDTFNVDYSIISNSNQTITTSAKVPPIEGNGHVMKEFSYGTEGLNGRNQLLVEANPDKNPLERSYLNNIGTLAFQIQKDQKNPVLDVTFDGKRILDGDLVSFEPLIQISLTDENEFLALADTALFDIKLRDPAGQLIPIRFSDPRVTFHPANTQNDNEAMVEFTPLLEQDGQYELTIQASDVTGNESGEQDYRVSFEVIQKRSISNILPYPNPFSTATQFVYTLTGNEAPEYFLIRIMTVSGRVVREISKEEFGPMEIGTHLSQFVWDGTDEFGDRLANGVYLYQVLVRNENRDQFEHFENQQVDQFFQNGIGKIVLVR